MSFKRAALASATSLSCRSAWSSAFPAPDAPLPEAWTQILKGKEGKGAAEVVIVDVAKADLDNLAISDLTLADPLPFPGTEPVAGATP